MHVRAALACLPLLALAEIHLASAGDDKKQPSKPPSAQQVFRELFVPFNDSHQYLAHVKKMRGLEDRYRDSQEWKSIYFQSVGTVSSFVGRYQEALACFDRTGERILSRPADAGGLRDYDSQDAMQAILELASQRQVVMINEAHHVPLHRAFVLQLLEGLYRKGFRYFAAEALTAQDKQLQKRGYPTMATGYYLPEPLCADLVRTALRLGYQVVPYEDEGARSPMDSKDPIAAQNARESGQAKNLKERILAKDPQAKILVHAGYGHIAKTPETLEMSGKKGEIRLMANNFKAITGIDPLSIAQDAMTEHSVPSEENPDYRLAIERGLLKDKPVVLRDPKSKAYYGPTQSEGKYDLVVFHPRSVYERGRPTWLSMGGLRHAVALPEQHRPTPGSSYLAQAFYPAEKDKDAIPVDQIEYRSGEPVPCLWLPKGEFRVRILDEAGKTVCEFTSGEPGH